ncbi:iron chaperone [Terrabacter terrae]|uniref:Iron chaperone n=1 Tax=Terrabacter terrae TaxID=318434 RepID=A0ABN2UBW4_9MICO
MGTVADHLASLPAEQRETLQRVVDVAARTAPDAVEGTSYGVPALLVDGRPLLGVRAAVRHLSVFPFSSAVVDAVAADLDGFSTSKGTIRFEPGHPLPDELVERLVRLRRAELEGDAR